MTQPMQAPAVCCSNARFGSERYDRNHLAVDVGAVTAQLSHCTAVRLVETDQRADDQVRCDHPLSIQIQFLTIHETGIGISEVEIQGTDTQHLCRIGFYANMMDISTRVERTGIVGRHFTLEPGAVTAVETEEQRIKTFIKAGVAIVHAR